MERGRRTPRRNVLVDAYASIDQANPYETPNQTAAMKEEKKYQQASPEAHFWLSFGFLIGSIINWRVSGRNPFVAHIDWPIGYIVTPLAWVGLLGVSIGLIEWFNNRRKKP